MGNLAEEVLLVCNTHTHTHIHTHTHTHIHTHTHTYRGNLAEEAVQRVATAKGKAPAQILLRWVLQHCGAAVLVFFFSVFSKQLKTEKLKTEKKKTEKKNTHTIAIVCVWGG